MSLHRQKLSTERLERRDVPTTIRIDYTYDLQGFFSDPERRGAIERVAADLGGRLEDTLSAIAPSGGNRWTASFHNAITDTTLSLTNPTIGTNEIVVYVGGGPLGGGELAVASGGAWSASGSSTWLSTVRSRGQDASEIAPWGGFIAFDSLTRWDFAPDSPPVNRYDFDSVATHELLHILGIGLGDPAYERHISGGEFRGASAVQVFGGPIPLEPGQDHGHWADGVTSGGQTAIMVDSLPIGVRRTVTPLDLAVLQDIGWDVVIPPVVSEPPPVPVTPIVTPVVTPVVPAPTNESPTPTPGVRVREVVVQPSQPVSVRPPTGIRFAVGSGSGTTSTVTAVSGTGLPVWTVSPFGDFTGGVRTATADVNADGVPDVVVGTGPGRATQVTVYDGSTRAVLFTVAPFEASFTGGVYVAAGDVTGDGRAEVVVTPDQGGGPRVRVYQGETFNVADDFFGIEDVNFRGGARAAVGDVNSDGRSDIIVAAGFGGGPRVAGFDGSSLGTSARRKLFNDFFAFEQSLRNGTFVSVGDVDNDGKADLSIGGGPGGGPRVTVFDGADLLLNRQLTIADFFSGDAAQRGGVRTASVDVNGDGVDDLITGAGDANGARVTVYDGRTLSDPTRTPLFEGDIFPGFSNGVFVG